MDEKKTMEVEPIYLPDDQVNLIIKAVTDKTNKHIDEVFAKLDRKSVVIEEKDVRKAVQEILAENKVEEKKKTAEPKNEKPEEEEVTIVPDKKKEAKFRIFSLGALKYLGAGAVGVGAGVAGKTAYNNYKAKKAAKSEYIDASYNVSADYN